MDELLPTTASRALLPRRDTLPGELFVLYSRNTPLLLIVGFAWFLLGWMAIGSAAWLVFVVKPNQAAALTNFNGAAVFFYGALLLTPAIHLLRYRAAILRATAAPRSTPLNVLLDQQQRFWRFVGAMFICVLLLFIAVLLVRFL